jgi:hypothetical protein
MVARRLRLLVVASLCGLACTLVVGGGLAVAATHFGGSGGEAGQFEFPTGVAVNAAGDVYVGDTENARVDKFSGSGSFTLAWGTGVVDGTSELQTCTSSCERGGRGNVTGGFESPTGVAVDDELSSTSYGDVYVVDWTRARVEKYDPAGKFLLMFGGHVNQGTGANVCVAGETCQAGVQGTGNGEFSYWPSLGSFVAVGPGGGVYVGDQARVQVFEASGVWKENILLASLSSTGRPSALAVDSAGDVYVKDEGVAGVRELEPGGVEKSVQFDAASETVTALALDPSSGNVYVGDSNGGFHVLEYGSTGSELASFGFNTVIGRNEGLAFSQATKQVYASAGNRDSVWVLAPPPPGPVIDSESAIPGLRGIATLEAMVDPEGNEATYHFEYVDEAHFQAGGYASASSTPGVSITSGLFEDHPASANLTGLVPGDTYHYRLVAHDSAGHTTNGPDQVFEATPAALIEGPWATNVAGTSVTLAARIDPLGASTEYRFEYGTSTAYGHTLSGNVGEGEGYVPVGHHIQELEPGTTYHYRVVTTNAFGTVEGADHTFTTQLAGGQGLSLPDGRAWELVSPPDKGAALIGPVRLEAGVFQAAGDGSGVTYPASQPVGEGAVGYFMPAQILTSRGVAGWSSQDVSPRVSLPPEGTSAKELNYTEYWPVFSADLSLGLLEPSGSSTTPQSPEATTERTLYLRNSAGGKFVPLESQANVPPGTKFADPNMQFLAGTPTLDNVIFGTSAVLTPEAKSGQGQNLYEWSAGGLELVNITPSTPGSPNGTTEPGAYLGSYNGSEGMSARAISSDGRWVVWVHGDLSSGGGVNQVQLYVRDMVDKKTLRLGGNYARFETMSADGSKVFFIETKLARGGDLYVFDTATGTQTDLTANHGAGEQSASVQEAVMGASEDGSYIYFVATGVLANGAVSRADNVYVLHDTGSGWTTTYIATLAGEDAKTWRGTSGSGELPKVEPDHAVEPVHLPLVASRVSPNGRYVTFMSERSLTGYDNLDAISGQPDEEVYLYDAVSNRLVCVSCDPTGARPVGVFDNRSYAEALFVDLQTAWSANEGSGDHWLAGSIPGWEKGFSHRAAYQPRYLSDSGRLFFNSPDALVPQDTNGLEDVYQYEPAGVGSCTSTSTTFSGRSQGCVSLISSGQSASESMFQDASESGNDVFFTTNSRLAPEDYDTAYDVYDAHVCSATVPCRAAPVRPPPCTSGDSCKAAPSPQPEIFGPAPSATFSGTGNVLEEAKKRVVTKKRVVKHKRKPKRKKPARHAGQSKGKKAGRPRRGGTSGKGNR